MYEWTKAERRTLRKSGEFTWPSATPTADLTQTLNGYHLQSWDSDGMTFWVASDLNEAELRQFVSLYRQK